MIMLFLSLLVGAGLFSAAFWGLDFGTAWSVTAGLVGLIASQIFLGRLFKRRMMGDMDRIQLILAEGQRKLQAKTQRWQFNPPGSIQAAQREVFQDTVRFVREALAATECMSKYRFWIPFIERQKATMQLQLNWMIKDFRAVDQLMPKALMLDPTMAAIKMARLYMTDAKTEEIGKVYRKAVGRVRYNGNVLLAATWSWILVQRGDADGAFKALGEALKKSDNASLKANYETLMNNRVAHFTNSGLGDQWYALHLEEPRIRTQRQHPVYR